MFVELYKLTMDDIEDVGSAFIVKIQQIKTYTSRSFVISDDREGVDLLKLCLKYDIRFHIKECNKYFLFYSKGKYGVQVV